MNLNLIDRDHVGNFIAPYADDNIENYQER